MNKHKQAAQKDFDLYSSLIGGIYIIDKCKVKVLEVKILKSEKEEDYSVWVTCERIDKNIDKFPLKNYELMDFLSKAIASE